jgi:hypothetical protein
MRDLYRVNFEMTPLKPFSSLAFPVFQTAKIPLKRPSFGDELVTSFLWKVPIAEIRTFCGDMSRTTLSLSTRQSKDANGACWRHPIFPTL